MLTATDCPAIASGGWSVSGHVPISDLPDFGINLPADSDAYNSVGGLVFHEIGRMPRRGDTVTVEGYRLRVGADQIIWKDE